MPQKVKTRFAPSPTGFLHVGGLRTALYAYLFAKKNKGEFLLRIEDTDQERQVTGAVENLQKVLLLFDLKWDNKTLVIQSERLEHYQQLISAGQAYYCFCSKERLDQVRQIQQTRGVPPMYDGHCRHLNPDEIKNQLAEKEPYVIRLAVPKTGQTKFTDLIRGKVIFDNQLIDDQVILKSDGFPTYHLASVVDDNAMAISHVIRGEEWLPSTPKHILLYQALGWTPPEFAHLPLLLNPDKSKLSKRQGDVAVEDYLKKGYLKEALLNFILFLGWNPKTDQEIFSFEEMVKVFDLTKVNKSGAVFDTQKLDWLNGHYIRQKPLGELTKLCQGFFQQAGVEKSVEELEPIVATEKNRIKKLEDIVEATKFFFIQPEYEPALLLWKDLTSQQAGENLKLLGKKLNELPAKDFEQKILEDKIMAFLKETGKGTGEMLWPMRVALSGQKNSPGPFEIASALGKAESNLRIKKAIALLEKK